MLELIYTIRSCMRRFISVLMVLIVLVCVNYQGFVKTQVEQEATACHHSDSGQKESENSNSLMKCCHDSLPAKKSTEVEVVFVTAIPTQTDESETIPLFGDTRLDSVRRPIMLGRSPILRL